MGDIGITVDHAPPPQATSRWLPVTLLIRADKLRTGQDVAPHCSLDLRFPRVSWFERDNQRVELMEVTVPADRRTRAAIARLFEIIDLT
jgi:hypothetical protein